jgi:type II secretory pathway component PulF
MTWPPRSLRDFGCPTRWLNTHPSFPRSTWGLVELGETSSHIDETLEKLADLLEKQVRLAKRLQSALVYPAFLVAVSMAAVGVFLQYVLPTMIPLFKSFSLTLPLPTRMLLASRHLVWPSVIVSLLGVLFWSWFRPAWNRARRRKAAWAYRVDRWILKIPLFGKFIAQIAIARVLFALATMIETGLPIMNALKRCESVASNLEFAGRLEKAGDELRDGSTVTEALALYEVLPSSCLHLLSAGEESAQMAEMVQYAARFYEEEVDHSIDQFMSLVEPVIMCVMGVVVGFIVLSAVLPTVEMINHLGA